MNWRDEWKPLLLIVGVFLGCYYLPLEQERFTHAVLESLALVKWYAQEHVLLCLIPAFFIAGAIAVFVKQEAVMKYLGADANRVVAYLVASVSGTILAVCSCTILPLFMGIYRMGAGLGPACTFLYAGPAINVLAIILTARILGTELGIARAVGAIGFSIIIGLLMQWLFRREDLARIQVQKTESGDEGRPFWQTIIYFGSMVAILVCANFAKPVETTGTWYLLWQWKWVLTAVGGITLAMTLALWYGVKWLHLIPAVAAVAVAGFLFPNEPLIAFTVGAFSLTLLLTFSQGEGSEWMASTWTYAKIILPLLLIGVLVAGLLLGRVGQEGLIPSDWVASAVGGNSLLSNFIASFAGAFMYFATLTEVPILQGLIGSGMGKGPALALLLAGPALSLPSMLVINAILGFKKTAAFVTLVILLSTVTGYLYGLFFA